MSISAGHTEKHARVHPVSVILCLAVFGIGFFTNPPYLCLLFVILTLCGITFKLLDIIFLSLVCGLTTFFCEVHSLRSLWPLPLAMALLAVVLPGKLIGYTRGGFEWIKRGKWGWRQMAISALLACASGLTLIAWYVIVNPDISDLTGVVPRAHPAFLILSGLLFSTANAFCEEFLWRGMIFNALERSFSSGAAVVGIQALSFGLAHVHGFPRGVSGMVLASIYGLLAGCFRKQAGGLLAPIIAHALTDAVIFSILAFHIYGKSG